MKMFGAFTSACCMKLRMLFFVVLTSCMLCLTQHHGAEVLSLSDVTTLVPGADDIIPCSGSTQHISFMKLVKSDIIDRVNESWSVYFGFLIKKTLLVDISQKCFLLLDNKMYILFGSNMNISLSN